MLFHTLLLMSAAQAADLDTAGGPVTFWRPYHRPPPPPPPRHRRPVAPAVVETVDHNVTLSLSALPLAMPMLELSGEARLADKASLGLIGGMGTLSGIPRFELGAQARGYFAGDFDRGLALGVEGRYGNLSLGDRSDRVLAVGPVLAAKYTGRVPLTVEGQLGLAYVQAQQWGGIEPIVRLNFGWSF